VASDDLTTDRGTLMRNTKEFWRILRSGLDVSDANSRTAENDVIFARWIGSDRLDELLDPLLDSGDAEVRYMAAARLATATSSDRAWAALEELSHGQHGAISSSARLLVAGRAA
jgi:hypothetical protein